MPLYKADPNNSKRQVPISNNPILKRVGHATAPDKEVITKRPTYVVINQPGTYAFAYESGSVSTYITGSHTDADTSTKLDINPTAWRQTDAAGAIGDVTFVYRRIS